MARLIALGLLAYCCLQSGLARADDAAKQLVGSWKLSSWAIQIIGGELTEPFGANPKGRSVFTPNGYVAFVIVAANRKPATNDAESAALLKTLVAHTGNSQSTETSLRPKWTFRGTSFSPGRIRCGSSICREID
jgi:hypothetical protein